MKYKLLIIAVAIILVFSSRVWAQEDTALEIEEESDSEDVTADVSVPKIIFPITELGNCTDKEACRKYCNKTENIPACIEFAREHNLAKPEDVVRASKFASLIIDGGPGGCTTPSSCRAYCEIEDNKDICIAFAEEHNLADLKRLEQLKKLREALKQARALPGNCKNETACAAYCKNEQHAQECLLFANRIGVISEEKIEQAKKILEIIRSGEGPGGCSDTESCRAYCQEDENKAACAEFGIKGGFMTEKEAESYKLFGGAGPGGCRGEECREYCKNPENKRSCIDFAKRHKTLMETKGRVDLRRENKENTSSRSQNDFSDSMPPEVKRCLQPLIGDRGIEQIRESGFNEAGEIGKALRQCLQPKPSILPGIRKVFPTPDAMKRLELQKEKERLELERRIKLEEKSRERLPAPTHEFAPRSSSMRPSFLGAIIRFLIGTR